MEKIPIIEQLELDLFITGNRFFGAFNLMFVNHTRHV